MAKCNQLTLLSFKGLNSLSPFSSIVSCVVNCQLLTARSTLCIVRSSSSNDIRITAKNLYHPASLYSYMSYFSMAKTHWHRPSQAVDAIFIFSGSKSGLLQKRARICFIIGAGMLSWSQQHKTQDTNQYHLSKYVTYTSLSSSNQKKRKI